MAGLLSPFLYSLPTISSFLDLVAMAALRRRMQVLRKIWPDRPLPPPLVISSAAFVLFTPLFLTTYDWSSLSFSLLASAYFFLSGSGRDGRLAPSNVSAQKNLARKSPFRRLSALAPIEIHRRCCP
jgi:hypothetical protein